MLVRAAFFRLVLAVVGWAWLSFSAPTFAQSPPADSATRSVHPFRIGGKVVADDGRARNLVALILKQYGLRLVDEEWDVYVTPDSSETPNAAANFDEQTKRRQIYFNRTFIDRISQAPDSNWTLYAIAAHEIAHQLANHTLRRVRTRLAEREADYHAGFVISRMGAPYRNTIDVVRWLPGSETSDYPTRSQRLCEIGRGWRDGQRLDGASAVTTSLANPEAQVCEDAKVDERRYKLRRNRDMVGNDIMFGDRPGIPGIDIAACAARCDENAQCKAFSFDRWHGWCFLKTAIVPSNMNPSATIGVKLPGEIPNRIKDDQVDARMQRINGRLFFDRAAEPIREADSYEACSNRCMASGNCVAFSWLTASKLCSLFNETEGHYVDPRGSSGYKIHLPKKKE